MIEILLSIGPGKLTGPLCLLLACLATGHAAEPATNAAPSRSLSLEDLVAEVTRTHPELEYYRAEIAAARGGRSAAAQWNNPEVTASLGSKRAWERSGGATLGDGVAWSVALAQTFEFPGRLALRKAIAGRQIELAELGLEQCRAALAARARQLGYSLHVAQEKVVALREVSGRFNSLLEVVVQRDPAGVAPLLDTRIIEANSVALGRRALQAEQEQQAALIELNTLRGQPPGAPLRLSADTAVVTNLPPLACLLECARTNNFELRARSVELAQQGFKVQLARNERWPSVTLEPFYSEEKAADAERIAGVGVTVPLPLWNRNAGNIEAAQARVRQAEAGLRAACLQVEKKVTEHALAWQIQADEMRRWRGDTAAQFREAAALADRHYRLGAVPVTTYVEMQLRYLDALDALLATRGEGFEHRQQLELLLGRPLETLSAH